MPSRERGVVRLEGTMIGNTNLMNRTNRNIFDWFKGTRIALIARIEILFDEVVRFVFFFYIWLSDNRLEGSPNN